MSAADPEETGSCISQRKGTGIIPTETAGESSGIYLPGRAGPPKNTTDRALFAEEVIKGIIELRNGSKMREYAVRSAAACLFLWLAAVPDIRSQRSPVLIPASFAAAAAAANLCLPACVDGRELWAGALPGAFLLLLSCAMKGKIGEGDGICLLVSGLMTGLTHAVILAETALILVAAAGAICIWTGRKKAEGKIAFVPFLAAAQSLILAVEVVKTARV